MLLGFLNKAAGCKVAIISTLPFSKKIPCSFVILISGFIIFAATRNPAKSIGIYDEVGSLSVGKKADILLVTDDLELREVL